MIELVIIADDLTGAIDTGVQLSKQDISTTISIEPDVQVGQLISTCNAQILVFNTESRHIKAKEASKRVIDIIKKAKKAGILRFYKKTDSTMRGNIGAELEAFLYGSKQRSLPFIPAHPKLKRFTRNGFHFVDRQLLHETVFAKDPLEPIKTGYIPELLHQQTEIPVHIIDHDKSQDISEKQGILVFNCDSIEELEKIGDLLFTWGLSGAISGSAAMAQLLPALLKLKRNTLARPDLRPPALIINGSLNNISHQQVKYASEKGVKTFPIPEELFAEHYVKNSRNFIPFVSRINREVHQGESIILSSTNPDHPVYFNGSRTDRRIYNHENVSLKIGRIVASILNEIKFSTLMVIGGDTLLGVMRAIGCESIEPRSEIFPGVALSLAAAPQKTIQLVTKPGGYGDKDIIIRLLKTMNKQTI